MKTVLFGSLLFSRLSIIALAQSQAPPFTISTVAGNGTTGFSGDGGPATHAAFNNPLGVAVDAAKNLYIVDSSNNRVRKVAPNGIITTYAGNGTPGFSGDGGPATNAALSEPSSILADNGGNLYIGDSGNRVRKVAPDGTIVTVAGNGNAGYSGDGGQATSAAISSPGVGALDAAGNLFIAIGATGTGAQSAIRKVTPAGIITTVAGNGTPGYSGDGGPAISATVNRPRGLAINGAGDLFFADQGNNRIRKISGGIITTVVGNGTAGYAGDGGPAINAELSSPTGIAFDAAGNLYIADGNGVLGNSRVRVLLPNGTITTVAGNGAAASSGDGGPASSASLVPWGLATSSAGAVYVSGTGTTETVRLLTPVPQAPAISPSGVVSASAFGGFTSVAPGSWIEIYGSNLASDTRSWATSDFSGVNAPTSLDGTSVTVGGESAFVDFISPGQVNALMPSNVATGSQPVIVKTAVGTSAPFSIAVNPVQPGLLAPPSFAINGTPYAVALFADGTYVLPTGAIAGIASRPAKAGDTIVLYGVGFGPVTPSIPAGQLVGQTNTLADGFQMFLGGLPATASYAGLAPNYTGLYQFNIVIPNVAAGNAVPLTFTLAGMPGSQTLYISIQN